ncbi:aldehyde dehydrogenase family protein [Mycolicibacterium sp. BiH015]|uniref:aldehyde dehydrogenase family protein n=1 Tax=Mycolicibacterium sp. BiH015 TaxID=3018808 RepID=UPI0022E0C632|nr:aldehyde dehydrogenase family protein [Mycolicibacterium sp. BiH015]MDA2892767.1 aldehyde dehydrogenase family protein [Mycolicibacterium sp. BiH015]
MAGDRVVVDALGPGGRYRTHSRAVVADARGEALLDMSVVPRLYVTRTIAAQRKAAPLAVGERGTALGRAAEIFVSKTIAGLDFHDYVDLTCRISGLPLTVARAGADVVAESLTTALESVRAAIPAGATMDWRDQPAGAVWARRGEVLAVHAPGNAPGVHGLWPQALALGYRVAVRPSRREPLTAHRLVTALRLAGFADTDASYLPTGHTGADAIVRSADLALVYGGRDVAQRYEADPAVFVNGPGRSKILITAEQDWRDHLDVVVDSVAALGGMACVNATAVLYEGEAEPLARAIGERLALLQPLPNTDQRAVLPTMPREGADALAAHLARRAAAATAILGAEQVVADVGDGLAALRPAVHLLSAPDPRTLGVELPFPCVWVSPWSRDDGLTPLRDSLALTAISSDGELIDRLVQDPTIVNVYRGGVPTHRAAPQIPHDGFLADFLMRNKGFVGG